MGVTIRLNGVNIDNRFVVPYNLLLLMKYQTHINLEFCNKSNALRYLFKCVNKGPYRVTMTIGDCSETQYYDCHYLFPSESMWRIFVYEIHHRLSFGHPSSSELFYMRMFLNVQKRCTSFWSIRTMNFVTYDTFSKGMFSYGGITKEAFCYIVIIWFHGKTIFGLGLDLDAFI
ncbi:hypothetical protein AHAS_Ahas12G0216400 [Arachis hypogaea]